MRLETFIRDAFLNKQEVVSIFFYLEKAYDTTWKYGILKDLHEAGLRGRMPIFISKFLDNRNFKVRIGSTFSDPFEQEMGVPQGSILSVTLFSLKINSLDKVFSKDVEGSLNVDDFLMSYRAKSTRTCERQLNTIHHQGLRLALGAFRTSPVESLYVEAGELPLEHRIIKLSLQYVTKLKSTPSNPAFNCVFKYIPALTLVTLVRLGNCFTPYQRLWLYITALL